MLQMLQMLLHTLHNVGVLGLGIAPTSWTWPDSESQTVSTGATVISMPHVSTNHLRKVHAQIH